jgi:hypothetical protein
VAAKVPKTPATGQRKRTAPIRGENALIIAEQVRQVTAWLCDGHRPFEIRQKCADNWGLSDRTAEDRMAAARRQMLADVSVADRQEIAAQAMHAFSRIALESLETRQLSNAIGAWRAYCEIAGVMGKNAQ